MSWARELFRNGPGSPMPARQQLLRRLHRDQRLSADAVAAIAQVPRELFVSPEHREVAYEDAALEIGPQATISAPSMVAEMLGVMRMTPGLAVLEIGSGSGYAAAALAAMGAHVIGLELAPEIAEKGRRNLVAAGFANRVRIIAADGRAGWPDAAPYDRVIASAAVDAVPQAWLDQLAPGGMLVYPEAAGEVDLLVRLTHETGGGWQREVMGQCRFVRMQL